MTTNPTIEMLKNILRISILDQKRVDMKPTRHEISNTAYDISWSTRTKEWAELCGLDLSKHDPSMRVLR